MSWFDESAPGHEGYADHVVRDGRVACFTTAAGLGMSLPYRDVQLAEVLPWSELLGWEARCDCGWVGPMWRRTDPDHQDPSECVLSAFPWPSDAAAWARTVEDAIEVVWAAQPATSPRIRPDFHSLALI